jgi:voltage-gated potassium channel Kch
MDKRHFVVQPMNIVDLMAILPLYLFFINNGTSQTSASKILRVLRVLRILKFSKYSSGLVVLGNTALACREQMVHLLMGLTVFSILFAAIIFFVEEDGPANQFDSIPHSMWWAVVTMLTIGYGDMFPVSNAGRVIGSLCAILGVVLIALPISVISNKFTEKFIEYTTGKKVRQRRLEIRNRLAYKLRSLFFSTIGPDRQRRRGSE